MTNRTEHLNDELLNTLVDGNATTAERTTIETHLATCQDCSARLTDLFAIRSILGDMDTVAPPRSFSLTAEQAKKPVPLRPAETNEPDTIVRMLPIMRTLSVAAILVFMVLGGALGKDMFIDDPASNDSAPSMQRETNPAPSTSEDQNQDAEVAIDGITDQGDSASSGTGAMDPTATGTAQATDDAADGLSTLQIATLSTAVLALILTASWFWMSHQIGASR